MEVANGVCSIYIGANFKSTGERLAEILGGRGSNVFAQEENHLFGGLGGGADVECDLDVREGQMVVVVVVLGWVLKCWTYLNLSIVAGFSPYIITFSLMLLEIEGETLMQVVAPDSMTFL